jgi:hypothetical protein
MISEEEQEKLARYSTLNLIQIFEPTYRNVLFIISKDKEAFTGKGMIELLKSAQTNTPNPKMAAMLGIYMEVLQRGYVKQDGLTSKITMRGRWHLLTTHPSIGFWSIIAAFFIGAASTSIPIYLSHLTRPEAPQTKPKESSSPSLPVHPSTHLKDTSKKK